MHACTFKTYSIHTYTHTYMHTHTHTHKHKHTTPTLYAASFEWDADGARALLSNLGGKPDLIIACDCIFAPLFGDSFLLLEMLLLLSSQDTYVLLGVERRNGDGVDRFFDCAREAGFEIRNAKDLNSKVLLVEMRKRHA